MVNNFPRGNELICFMTHTGQSALVACPFGKIYKFKQPGCQPCLLTPLGQDEGFATSRVYNTFPGLAQLP